MRKSRHANLGFWWNFAGAAAQASMVVPLRLMRMAQGGAKGQAEAQRMISEKAAAFFEAQVAMVSAVMLGQSSSAPRRAFVPYRRRVRANHRRLTPKF